jgi:hypothetical protein
MNKKQYLNISKSFDCYVSLYDHNKYPGQIYESAKRSFSSLKSNEGEISDALNWKYGNIGKANYPEAHKRIIKEVANSWQQFVRSTAIKSPEDTFDWWKSRLSKGKSSRFVTIAFITHLVHHKKHVPIIDQHNYRAMNYFKNNSVLSPDAKKNPSNWDDIECLKGFISDISKSLNKKNNEVDKYLMMFGKELKKK